jgi:hypothetical protein
VLGEDIYLQARERGLRRNQPYWHLGLRHVASRILRKYILVVKVTSLWYFVMAVLIN